MSDLNSQVKRAVLVVIGSFILIILGLTRSKASVAEADSIQTLYSPNITTTYLANPGIGWQEAQTLHSPLLPETTPYRRPQYSWQVQNPSPNQFNWDNIDTDLANIATEGGQLSFRVYTMRGYGSGHKIPQWALNEGAELFPNGEPNYSNCVYQQRWGEFVEAMRARYDGNPHIAFIDISGYGNYSEWSWQDQTVWEADFMNPISLDAQARKRLADLFIGGSGSVECRHSDGSTETVNYNYTGFQQTQLVMPYAGIQASSRYVSAQRPDVGIRHDCLGSASHTDDMMTKIGDVIEATWRNAPIIYELCRIETGSATFPQFMSDANEILRQTHGSTVHDNTSGTRDVEQFADLLRYAGYRYSLNEVTFPQAVQAGQAVDVAMSWQNIGYAPAYAKMGQAFGLHLYLVDSAGNVVADWGSMEDVNSWMPANQAGGNVPINEVMQRVQMPAVSSGNYTLATSIVDSRTNNPIQLSIDGEIATGLYAIGQIELTQSSTPPPTSYTFYLPFVR